MWENVCGRATGGIVRGRPHYWVLDRVYGRVASGTPRGSVMWEEHTY